MVKQTSEAEMLCIETKFKLFSPAGTILLFRLVSPSRALVSTNATPSSA